MALLKLFVCGYGASGKTTLCKRYFKNMGFDSGYTQTQTLECYSANFTNFGLGKGSFGLSIFDFAGQPYQRPFIGSRLFGGSHGGILLYDLTNPLSYNDLFVGIKAEQKLGQNVITISTKPEEAWLNLITKNNPKLDMGQIILVANKSDLVETRHPKLGPSVGIDTAKKCNFGAYFETSAKSGAYVQEACHYVIGPILVKNGMATPEEFKNFATSIDERITKAEKMAQKKAANAAGKKFDLEKDYVPYHWINIHQAAATA